MTTSSVPAWLHALISCWLCLPALAAISVSAPRCEGVRQPQQVDTAAPRFSWRLDSDLRDTRQAAYQLRIAEVDGAGRPLRAPFETPRIETEASQWVSPPGFTAAPRSAYTWQVRVWDNHGAASDWSAPEGFATGLLGEKWPADWISDGRLVPLHGTAPARHFRQTFHLDRLPVRARLFVSAFGIVEPWLNGHLVTADRFVPGWPDYRQRVFYVSFDVTSLLRRGNNTLGLLLGDGWYSGTLIPQHQFGQEPLVSAFLDLTDADGRVTTVTTDKDWRWSDAGPIRMNSIYDGETYDARRELAGWSTADGPARVDWQPVVSRRTRTIPATLTARLSPPVRRIQTLQPVSVRRTGPHTHIYDLGQNMVGWVRLRVNAAPGQEVTLRFAEMLDAKGNLYTANLRTAKATARYTAKGGGLEEWEPRFTYFGFRYVELAGVDAPHPDAIEGVVVHSDLPRVGTFACSDPLLNQLYHNALWSQKGNFLELPTDCPQRDERAGWTGDAQIFAHTALYNLDAGAFYRQWLYAVRDGLRDGPDGGFPDIAPASGFGHGTPGWADAGEIVPWMVWLHTADRRVLAETMPALQHALELMAAQAPGGIRHCAPGYGDWLAPGFDPGKAPPRPDLIATAFYAHAADLGARMADVLGEPELAARDRALFNQARRAYEDAYIGPDGRMVDDVQTSYVLTLAFDLAPVERRGQIVSHLLRTIAAKDDHLATGFLGTPLLTPVLTRAGHAEVAYKILEQTSYPGWLFTVKNGATTIWERWDSWTPERGFNPNGMNSFNHYSYGSVVGWFYDTIAGLEPVASSPGWKAFRIAPVPGGGLSSAAATVDTPYGPAGSKWTVGGGVMHLAVEIPVNTAADVVLPVRNAAHATLDGANLAAARVARDAATGRAAVRLPSGHYEFVVPLE